MAKMSSKKVWSLVVIQAMVVGLYIEVCWLVSLWGHVQHFVSGVTRTISG